MTTAMVTIIYDLWYINVINPIRFILNQWKFTELLREYFPILVIMILKLSQKSISLDEMYVWSKSAYF